jgi:hypothetical protein
MASAHSALYDEIQVYDDSLNSPGELGLEIHLSHTLNGRRIPLYAGEISTNHQSRITPEFSYGINDQWEAGLYLPTVLDSQAQMSLAGQKLRMKWIGQRSSEEIRWFYGVNFEISKVAQRYEASPWGLEIRPIIGYRNDDWLFTTNPILGYSLSPGYRQGGVDFLPALKVARRVATGLSAGVETYSDLGKLASNSQPRDQQHTFYWVLDVDHDPWVFNVGIGRGLNPLTDRWTIKAIFEVPIPN